MKTELRARLRTFLPLSTRRLIVRYTRWPLVGRVRFGDLRRLNPISPYWGSERGKPIDRYYIENFLANHSADIQGHVLEIGDNTYTLCFGGSRVTQSDVLHLAEEKSTVTILGDLTNSEHIPSNIFDCVILTQTLQTIFEVSSAIRTVYRILKPGGVALVTVPGISKVSRYDMDRWGYYWSFTTQSARRLFEAVFQPDLIDVNAHGNVLTSAAFLFGLATEELSERELDYFDPDYELLITVRASKPLSSNETSRVQKTNQHVALA
jgi:SAM-dependent methyltransferase